MQELLFISRMTLGDETQVLDLHGGFPQAALEGEPGVERVRAFLGSGFYALEITVADGDFQEQFHRFLGTPEVARFFDELRAHVTNLPTPTEETAHMPLAAPMLYWERQSSP